MNCGLAIFFVNASATFSELGTYVNEIRFSLINSRKFCILNRICFTWARLFVPYATSIAGWLSHLMLMGGMSFPVKPLNLKSLSNILLYTASFAASLQEKYSDAHDDRATLDWLLANQDMAPPPKINTFPDTDLISESFAQVASVYAIRFSPHIVLYLIDLFIVPFKYRNKYFTADI